MRIALDTNVLAYAEGINGAAMREKAFDLIQGLPKDRVVLPVQILGELFRVLVSKGGETPTYARSALLSWHDTYSSIETSAEVLIAAADLATDHRIGIWDSVVLAAAAAADCRLLLSEDYQEGFTWRGVTVTNPFAVSRHPLLASLLERH